MNNTEDKRLDNGPDPAVIVGAGVSGMTLAVLLAEAGVPVVVLERAERAGGLARSFSYDDYTFDIGPHRFHTEVDRVDALIRDVLGRDVHEISRKSWVRFEGQFYPWPLHPSYVMLKFPPRVAAGALRDLVSLMKTKRSESFRDQIVNMYGQTLYHHFFEGYSTKFLGITPELTHPDWARTGVDRAIIDKRLSMSSLGQLLFSMMLPRRLPELRFVYPDGGCERFIQRLARRLKAAGGQLYCGNIVENFEIHGGRITRITAGDRSFSPAVVVWSGTIHSLARAVGLDRPSLRYLALVCFNLMITAGKPFPFQWCYHGAPDIVFSRVSVPANFHPGNTPPGKRSLCVEVTCAEDDPMFSAPNHRLERVIYDLERDGLLASHREVIDARCEPVRWAYPVYELHYRRKLDDLWRDLSTLDNLIPAGRAGRFWYNNMDHCIEEALQLCRRILDRPELDGHAKS